MSKRNTKKRAGKKTLPFCYEKSFMAAPKYIDSLVDTYDGKFCNNLRIASKDELTIMMTTNTNYIFNGDSVGEWIRDNLDKCVFVPGTSSQNYAWWILYDYEERLFKLFINDKRVLPPITTQDPEEYFVILKDASHFVPIVVLNPISMLDMVKDKYEKGYLNPLGFTFSFPYYLWEEICNEGYLGFWKDYIISKKIGNNADPEDVLMIKMKSADVNSIIMLDSKDIAYISEAIIWETAESDFEYMTDNLKLNDSYFLSIVDKDIINATKDIDPIYKVEYRKRTRESLLDNVYADILIGDSIDNKSYRYITCIKILLEWSRGNIRIGANGNFHFIRECSQFDHDGIDREIILNDEYIIIEETKYTLDRYYLNTYIAECNSNNKNLLDKVLSDWSKWKAVTDDTIINIKESKEGEENMARRKKEEVIEQVNKDVLTEAPAEELPCGPGPEACNSVEVSIEQPKPKYDIETKEEERIQIRNKIMAEFATRMALSKNPYVPTEIFKKVGDQILADIRAGLKISLESYMTNVLIQCDELNDEQKEIIDRYILNQFFVYSIEERDTLLFADLGLYVVDTSNTRILNNIMNAATSVRKGLDDFRNQLNNLVTRELYHNTSLHYWDADGNSISDVVSYSIINSNPNPYKESAIMLFNLKGKVGKYAFLVTDNLTQIIRDKEAVVLDGNNPNVYIMDALSDNPIKVYGHILSDVFKKFAMGLNSIVEDR